VKRGSAVTISPLWSRFSASLRILDMFMPHVAMALEVRQMQAQLGKSEGVLTCPAPLRPALTNVKALLGA
jgi:hypothetical protein